MTMLQWREVSIGAMNTPFLKANVLDLRLDFKDLIQGRFWGSHDFHYNLSFSIHERIIKDEAQGWNYQLLFNDVHVYCKDIDEAKKTAELMYRRITDSIIERLNESDEVKDARETKNIANQLQRSLEASKRETERFNRMMWRQHCKKKKFKTLDLSAVLEKRGIVGRVYYSRLRKNYGWMFCYMGSSPVLIGSNYQQSLEFINSGALDFYKDKP